MKRAIFFNIDGTLTTRISGDPLEQYPQDVKVLPGVEAALNYYQNQEPFEVENLVLFENRLW